MDPLATSEEQETLETLDQSLRRVEVQPVIQEIATQVQQKLWSSPEATLAWEPVPIEIYGVRLPGMIRSSWVFVLRKGTTSGAERHPNSHQRVMSYRGGADLQTWENGFWRSHSLIADLSVPLHQRWLSIPTNVWHQPIMGAEDWVVVSFHTAATTELIEERGDPEAGAKMPQQAYVDRSNSQLLGAR